MKTEEKIFNYIKSNQEHSTMVGKFILVDHNNDDDNEDIMKFAKWMADFIRNAEKFSESNKK